MMDKSSFRSLARNNKTFYPASVISNLQGRNHTQNSIITIKPSGEVNYFSRSTVILQAPHFDFREFPFDTQLFEIHIDSILPKNRVIFKELEGFSSIGKKLGEEE